MTAHAACIPVQTEYLALRGITHVLTALEVAKRLNKPLELGGALCTHYDSRKILSRNTVQSIKDFFKDKVLNLHTDNIALAEAPCLSDDI
jgi:cellulose biosynthesis protein BcsQ